VVRFLKKVLEEHGYDLTATSSGKDALANIKERLPDLLILDLNMPAPDGFEILKKERATFPYLRILVISGYMEGALLQAAKLLGAVATLQKPLEADRLLSTVRGVLGR
jgi:CheY-like chemotaxis protein